jgi:hypothetical protein
MVGIASVRATLRRMRWIRGYCRVGFSPQTVSRARASPWPFRRPTAARPRRTTERPRLARASDPRLVPQPILLGSLLRRDARFRPHALSIRNGSDQHYARQSPIPPPPHVPPTEPAGAGSERSGGGGGVLCLSLAEGGASSGGTHRRREHRSGDGGRSPHLFSFFRFSHRY